jgi:hypothetical protein
MRLLVSLLCFALHRMAESDAHSVASQLDSPDISTAEPAMPTFPPSTVKLAAPVDAAFPFQATLSDAVEYDTDSDVLHSSSPTVAMIRCVPTCANVREALVVIDESDVHLLVSQLLLKARTAPETSIAPMFMPNTLKLKDPVTPRFVGWIELNDVAPKDKKTLELAAECAADTTVWRLPRSPHEGLHCRAVEESHVLSSQLL